MISGEPPLLVRLDQVIDSAISKHRIVGTVVLVSHRGEPVYRRAAGFADRETGHKMTRTAIFRLSSITKPMVAATALAQVDRGVLSLDAPVTDYLPWFRPALPDGSRPDILIRHLLTHSSGLTYDPVQPAGVAAPPVSTGLDASPLTLEQNLRNLAQYPLAFAPGTDWRYSLSTDVLGGVIAAIHGETLGDAVSYYVTGPLHMTDTGFGVSDRARLTTAYGDGSPHPLPMGDPQRVGENTETGTVFSPSRIFDSTAFHSGGAGMAGSAPDFMRFLETIRMGGTPILSAAMATEALRNQLGAVSRPSDPGRGFGFLGEVITDPALAHTPQQPGTVTWGGVYGHSWFIDPVAELSVVAFTNTALEGCNGAFPDAIRDAVYGV